MYDFYAELSKQMEEVKNQTKDTWKKIWDDRRIGLEEKQKEFEKEFNDKIAPNLFRSHRLNRKIIYPQVFKMLKVLDCNVAYLSDFAETLKKKVKNKEYYLKIPEELAKKEYFSLFISKEKRTINLRDDLERYAIGDSILNLFYASDKLTDPKNLPKYSTFIQIKFKLRKPFLSKDDDNFYIIDNPIAKDKVFKLPMVRASTWKGALRFAAIKVFEDWVYANKSKLDKERVFEERARIVKLFGNEKDAMENYLGKLSLLAINGEFPPSKEAKKKVKEINGEFEKWLTRNNIVSRDIPSRTGRLFFYPTFFDVISLDVITPLSRKTKTPVKGKGPIYFEIVPEETEGIFRLLYYPYDLIARGEFERIEEELKEDIEFLAKALKKMFYEIGFSAKKTSGFGVVMPISDSDVRVDGFEIDEVKEKLSILYTQVNKNVNHGDQNENKNA